jgi:hypothetical protein
VFRLIAQSFQRHHQRHSGSEHNGKLAKKENLPVGGTANFSHPVGFFRIGDQKSLLSPQNIACILQSAINPFDIESSPLIEVIQIAKFLEKNVFFQLFQGVTR